MSLPARRRGRAQHDRPSWGPHLLSGPAPHRRARKRRPRPGRVLRLAPPPGRAQAPVGLEELYAGAATGLLSTSSREAFEAVQMLKRVDPGQYRPANDADYPRGKLGKALLAIAQLIKADVGLQVAFADVTGWDTHVNQGATEGQLAGRLGDLGQALAAFTRDLGERMRDVVVLTMSEFGRTVRENGNSGTDHGHATAMLVL